MFAIVDIAGFQEKLEEGLTLRVPLHDAKEGSKVTFEKVLLIGDGDKITIGAPMLSGAKVEATVVKHGMGDKIRIQKFQRRKRYRRVKGHRQDYTEVKIGKITA